MSRISINIHALISIRPDNVLRIDEDGLLYVSGEEILSYLKENLRQKLELSMPKGSDEDAE